MAKGKVKNYTYKARPKNNPGRPDAEFWRSNLLKILDCLEHEELTWSLENWRKYGVSLASQQRILKEYAARQKCYVLD